MWPFAWLQNQSCRADSRHVWLAPHRSTAQVINMKTIKPLQVTEGTLSSAFRRYFQAAGWNCDIFTIIMVTGQIFSRISGKGGSQLYTRVPSPSLTIIFHKSFLFFMETLGWDFSHNSHNPLLVYKLIHTMSAGEIYFLVLHCYYFTLKPQVRCCHMQNEEQV